MDTKFKKRPMLNDPFMQGGVRFLVSSIAKGVIVGRKASVDCVKSAKDIAVVLGVKYEAQ